MRFSCGAILILIFSWLFSCSSPHFPQPYFDPSAVETCSLGEFAVPFPNPLWWEEGRLRNICFSGRDSPALRLYFSQISDEPTYPGLHHAVYFRFSQALDTSNWEHSPSLTTDYSLPFMLVNVDPSCDDYGIPVPVTWFYTEVYFNYMPPRTLGLLPIKGAGLEENCWYAAFLLDDIYTPGGEKFEIPVEVRRLLGGKCTYREMCQGVQYFLEFLSGSGIDRKSVLTFTVFKTGNFSQELRKVIYYIDSKGAVPEITDITHLGLFTQSYKGVTTGSFRLYEGHARILTFQHGKPPYLEPGEGAFVFDSTGDPVPAGWEDVRFTFAHPAGVSGSIPCVVYSHGTGGDAYTPYWNYAMLNVTSRGMGMISFDAPLHGEREPQNIDPTYTFFNPFNLKAARDNIRETAVEIAQFVRLAGSFTLSVSLNPDGTAVSCDPSKIFFMGHSQGAITGTPYLGVDDRVKGAVLSGGGGVLLYSLLSKEEPVSIPALLKGILGSDEKLTPFHFLINLFQMFMEPADPATYAPYLLRKRPAEFSSLHIFISEGMLDAYTPPDSAEALGGLAGIPQIEPVSRLIEVYRLDEKLSKVQASPVSLNVTLLSGNAVTAGFIQFPSFGHFALFDSRCGYSMWGDFLESLAFSTPVIDTSCLSQ